MVVRDVSVSKIGVLWLERKRADATRFVLWKPDPSTRPPSTLNCQILVSCYMIGWEAE